MNTHAFMEPDAILTPEKGLIGREYNIDGMCFVVTNGKSWFTICRPDRNIAVTMVPADISDEQAIRTVQEAMAAGEFKPLQEALQGYRQAIAAAK